MSGERLHSRSHSPRSGGSSHVSGAIATARAALAARLRERLPELETAVAARIYAIAEPAETTDPVYIEGLRSSLTVSLEYAVDAVELGEERTPPVPAALLVQARLAARAGVTLDTVLRRYFGGYGLFTEFVIAEAGDGDLLRGASPQLVLRGQAAVFDRLLATVSEEYAREGVVPRPSAEQRRAERVERLLAGEFVDFPEIDYDFSGHHLGLLGKGHGALGWIRGLAKGLDRRLLSVRREEGEVWAWLGGSRPLDPAEAMRKIASNPPVDAFLVLGEPDEGIEGWRLSHRQARAALPVALRSEEPVVRYRDVALLASTLQDDLLATSLCRLYLVPLECERDGGETLRDTLRAYFAAERNVSSAAVALGLSRQAVAKRLRMIERTLGISLDDRGLEVKVALRLHEVKSRGSAPNNPQPLRGPRCHISTARARPSREADGTVKSA